MMACFYEGTEVVSLFLVRLGFDYSYRMGKLIDLEAYK